VFSEFRGDWEWSVSTFLWRGYRHNFCCHRDWASKKLECLRYSDWSRKALWRTTQITHLDYLDMAHKRSVLTTIPGWHLLRLQILNLVQSFRVSMSV